jgi:purine-binding chemotaxis protein CheW
MRAPAPGARAFEALARAAARREAADEATLRREFVTFVLDGDPYALPIERVREIVRLRAITPVPRVPDAIRGVISLRGEVVEVLDLRRRLGLPESAPTRASRIVVLHGDDGTVTGLLVDAVRDVLRITDDEVRPASGGDHDGVAALLARGEQFVSLLDIERVLELAD